MYHPEMMAGKMLFTFDSTIYIYIAAIAHLPRYG